MLRKTHVIGLVSLLAANPCFSGFYVGGAFGPEAARFSQKAHVQRLGTFDVVAKQRLGGAGFFGTIFAGFSYIYKQIFIAAEVNGTLSSVEYKLTNDEYLNLNFQKNRFTIRNSYGVSALPGFLISPDTTLYGRIGYANGRVEIFEGADPSIQSSRSRKSGLRWGAGIRHAFTEKLSVMVDFSAITYRSVYSFVYDPNGQVTKSTKITPQTGQVAFGLIYRFDAPPPPVYVK
ncbi:MULTISPECIES: outer membrane protein [Legionella]|uniref:Outer membrane protein beta-barrel domain-containing protein n=1 Tax=Legionella drozanskii LLAP-1 TaxID=1212489 RepID=A0A0W0SWC7_9GAMM|nr:MULTISPECIES: outer membrane beta-barrel protein [Legionella]KTC87253.1 hypothetical protein Ldro_0872 [Legionella drozanskii LLAP-1]PJE17885.1 MAG: porin family protein [Legionella sp.]